MHTGYTKLTVVIDIASLSIIVGIISCQYVCVTVGIDDLYYSISLCGLAQ